MLSAVADTDRPNVDRLGAESEDGRHYAATPKPAGDVGLEPIAVRAEGL